MAVVAAQNPVRGVIRPVVGSKPLAIRTPTVGLAPTGNLGGGLTVPTPVINNGGFHNGGNFGQRGHRHGHHHHHHGGFYGGYPYYYSSPWWGLNFTFGSGYRSLGVVYGYPGAFYYGSYRYRPIYSSYRPSYYYGSFRPYLDSPLLYGADRLRAEDFGIAPIVIGDEPARVARPAVRGVRDVDEGRLERPPVSSVSRIRRSLRAMSEGDTEFRAGDFFAAQTDYRTAIRSSPDLAEPHLHYGMAMIACGRFEDAAMEFKKAIDYDPSLVESDFQWQDLYDDPAVMDEHFDKLAEFALVRKNDPEILFVIGVCLHFRGEPERAAPFLERVAELDGQWEFAVSTMLAVNEPAKEPAEERADG